MQTNTPEKSPTLALPRVVDVKEAAGLVGCSPRTFLRWSDRGVAPWGLKLGRLRRWRLDELETWLRDGCPRCNRQGVRR
jgi:excisionase family DNA binding protein